MKVFSSLLVASATMIFAGSASAAIVTTPFVGCGTALFGGTNPPIAGGAATLTCGTGASAAPVLLPGDYFTGVSVQLFGDFTGGINALNDVLLTHTLASVGGGFSTNPVLIHAIGGFTSSIPPSTPVPVTVTANFSGTSTTTVAAFNDSTSSNYFTGSSLVTGSSVGLAISYSYNTSAPEPASFAMIGGGLIALAVAARRRRRA